MKKPSFVLVFSIVVVLHFVIVLRNCAYNFPTYDEIGHLPAGISHWELRTFGYYKVNPPLVRLFACFPAWALGDASHYEWPSYRMPPRFRPEFIVGLERLKQTKLDCLYDFIAPRCLASSISLLAILLIFLGIGKSIGKLAAAICATFWMFSPDILAHSSTIGPDIGAVTAGIALSCSTWTYVKNPSGTRAILVGVVFGLTLLTKFTWLTAFLSIPLSILLAETFFYRRCLKQRWIYCLRDIGVMFLVAIAVVNLVYLFDGSFLPLSSYRFLSETLSGSVHFGQVTGNRFQGTWLSEIPIPFPKDFVLGVDFLKWEVEQEYWSFLDGEWKQGAWWYYYVLTVIYKTPLPLLFAAVLGFTVVVIGCYRGKVDSDLGSMILQLSIPALICFVSVSLQCGFSHHHRYVLMIYPPMFLFASLLASPFAANAISFIPDATDQASHSNVPLRVRLSSHWNVKCALILVLLNVAACLRVHPHYTSFFNCISGGPENGWKRLGSSCVDWGQDLCYVKKWIDEHPECSPIAFDLDYFEMSGELFGLPRQNPPALPSGTSVDTVRTNQTQWFVVSVKSLFDKPDKPGLGYLRELTPHDTIGYSYHVYRISPRMEVGD